jgi:hypothetical protein
MHLAVDHARKDMEPFAVERLGGPAFVKGTNADNPAIPHGNIALSGAVVIDDGSTLQNQIGPLHQPSLPSFEPLRKWCSDAKQLDRRAVNFPLQRLPERVALAVTGADSARFLHNLVTADVLTVADGGAVYTALLTPQGKMLFDFFLLKVPEGFLADCAAAQAPALLQRLSMYKLRAAVSISAHADLEIGVASDEIPGSLTYPDPRSEQLGWRCFAPAGTLSVGPGYHAARIAAGLADSDKDLGSGEFFPHEANLDQFGGVSFAKGCYIGQEVVSRMEHRGTARSRIVPVSASGSLPAKGTSIESNGKQIGAMLSSEASSGLAVLRLDRLAESRAPLQADGNALRAHKPSFANYDVPEPQT